MPSILTRFRIEKLHSRKSIDVYIEDNKLILVGENGTGKSTVVNFIYFFLTRQWERMLEYEFESIYAVINSEEIELTRDEIKGYNVEIHHIDHNFKYLKNMPTTIFNRIKSSLQSLKIEDIYQSQELMSIATFYDIPRHLLTELYLSLQSTELPENTKIKDINNLLQNIISDQILYLPTYRRIEQELRAIFPGIDDDRPRYIRERFQQRIKGPQYIELVEFGMEDVQKTINNKMNEIKEDVRSGLSRLTGTYLRDIIKGIYKNADFSKIKDLDENNINSIFNRIDERILPKNEQNSLRDIVKKINDGDPIQEDDKVVVHFLTQLIELHQAQKKKENDVLDFVRVCNIYLKGKRIVYDNLQFNIAIEHTEPDNNDSKVSKDKIDLKMLSSGEKQIVSLFSHIYLSGSTGYFVIIDEPELSLSVPWQRRFLPDILKSERCNGLIAVTHSPFIFENELDQYAHSLEEFVLNTI